METSMIIQRQDLWLLSGWWAKAKTYAGMPPKPESNREIKKGGNNPKKTQESFALNTSITPRFFSLKNDVTGEEIRRENGFLRPV